jgi:hypothetical protein
MAIGRAAASCESFLTFEEFILILFSDPSF